MTLHFKDPELDRLVRALARKRYLSLTDAVKFAVRRALGEPDAIPLDLAKAVDDMLDALAPLKERMIQSRLQGRTLTINQEGLHHERRSSDHIR